MSEKNRNLATRRFDASDILDSDTPELANIGATYKFLVKVGNKYGFRDHNSKNRYELSDKAIPFYSEVQAQECLRFFKNKGAVLDKQPA